MRFDMRAPGRSPEEVARLYETALEMAGWADERGCLAITVSEHHASDDGYLPSPLTMAAAVAAVTHRTPIMVAAAILPLHDPVRLAEEMMVLDHLSRGRIVYTLALGYRPEEYDLYGADFGRRGALAEEKLTRLLSLLHDASAGSAEVRVTPPPYSAGGPMINWGGGTKPAARRAGRHGLGFLAQTGDDPSLEDVYRDAAREHGHEPGMCILPSPEAPTTVFVHPDVDAGWREIGPALLADALAYHRWNVGTGQEHTTKSVSAASTVDELREEDDHYRVVTPDDAVALVERFGTIGLHPLCGGLEPDVAWTYLRRVADEVLPALGGS